MFKYASTLGLAALVALASFACGGNNTTAPTTPPVTTTDTFTSTLATGGANIHTFTMTKAGQVNIAFLSETVNDITQTTPLSIDLGVWFASSSTCSAGYTWSSPPGGTMSGTTSQAGTFCIRVYDNAAAPGGGPAIPAGTTVKYVVIVNHP